MVNIIIAFGEKEAKVSAAIRADLEKKTLLVHMICL